MDFAGAGREEAHKRAMELLSRVGIEGRLYLSRAGKLCGGEKQQAAIARAVANNPVQELPYEPNDDLDSDSVAKVVSLLAELAHREGKCMFIVTQDDGVLRAADRCYRKKDGRLKPAVAS